MYYFSFFIESLFGLIQIVAVEGERLPMAWTDRKPSVLQTFQQMKRVEQFVRRARLEFGDRLRIFHQFVASEHEVAEGEDDA